MDAGMDREKAIASVAAGRQSRLVMQCFGYYINATGHILRWTRRNLMYWSQEGGSEDLKNPSKEAVKI